MFPTLVLYCVMPGQCLERNAAMAWVRKSHVSSNGEATLHRVFAKQPNLESGYNVWTNCVGQAHVKIVPRIVSGIFVGDGTERMMTYKELTKGHRPCGECDRCGCVEDG